MNTVASVDTRLESELELRRGAGWSELFQFIHVPIFNAHSRLLECAQSLGWETTQRVFVLQIVRYWSSDGTERTML